MNLKQKLLTTKPKLKEITLNGEKYYIRNLTVGETNEQLYGQQKKLIELAEKQGIELDFNDEQDLNSKLVKLYDPFQMARVIACRLCDENGNNLFDPNSDADLSAICNLDTEVFSILSKATEEDRKNSQTDANSKSS